jgi:hypothetical protein
MKWMLGVFLVASQAATLMLFELGEVSSLMLINPPASGGGSGPLGGPTPTPSTGLYDPNAKKTSFVCKPDLKAYTELKSVESYGRWIEDTVCVLCAQGLGMFLDPTFVPRVEDLEEGDSKKLFVYMMLLTKVKTLTGMHIVKSHRPH